MSGHDDLTARAQQRAEAPPTPEEWGYRISIGPRESFVGRWRGGTTDPDNDDRRVFLFWDESGEPAYHRFYASLGREIDRVQPELGDTIVVARAENYKTQFDDDDEASGQSYGVEKEPCPDPLPGEPATAAEAPAKASAQPDDDEFPF